LAEQGRLAEAIEHYETTIRLEPRHFFGLCNLAAALAKLERDQEAIERFQQALRLDAENPANGVVHQNLGILFKRQGDSERAEIHFQEAERYSGASGADVW
jgi:tetratricopeptide (TPR) repeat protein